MPKRSLYNTPGRKVYRYPDGTIMLPGDTKEGMRLDSIVDVRMQELENAINAQKARELREAKNLLKWSPLIGLTPLVVNSFRNILTGDPEVHKRRDALREAQRERLNYETNYIKTNVSRQKR